MVQVQGDVYQQIAVVLAVNRLFFFLNVKQ